MGLGAAFPHPHVVDMVGKGAVSQQVVHLLKKRHRQGRCQVRDHIAHTDEVVGDFYQIINAHRLKGDADFPGAVNFNHLIPGEPVAGHAARGIGQIDLDVFVDAEVLVALVLVEDLLYEGCLGTLSDDLRAGFEGALRDFPALLCQHRTGDFSLLAVAPDHGSGDAQSRAVSLTE